MKRQPTEAQKQAAQEKRAKMRQMAAQVAALSDEQRHEIVSRLGLVTVEGRILSIYNQCMMFFQMPEASMVGGFQQWKRAGRMVQKGQHGACIWIPLGLRKNDEDDGIDMDPTGFMLATVFDVSQTEPMNTEQAAD